MLALSGVWLWRWNVKWRQTHESLTGTVSVGPLNLNPELLHRVPTQYGETKSLIFT